NDEFQWLAPHGFGHNWSLQVSPNPRCRQESRIFIDRIRDKQWQRIWPDLVVNWP
ncbi:nucleotidyltransferase family protein, partial [Aeromonas media]|uniref:nucleotidyltransferase family protein n=1 Tax=Aeromonas media TaxID=651 RepID=UPI001F11AD57